MYYKENVIRACGIKDYPPILQQATSLVSSVSRFIADGANTASEKDVKERLSICNGETTGEVCEYYDNNRCKKCGCFFATKLRMADEKCPIDKWGPINR